MSKIRATMAALAALLIGASGASATTIQITIENLSPEGGVYLTPVWVGFHDGGFDSYDGGSPASLEIERIAEDGNTGPISALFDAPSRVQSTLGGAPIAPGGVVSGTFDLDLDGANQYFSYASMVLTSNDYFVANGNPLAHDLSALLGGGSLSFGIGLPGTVNDAGTEVNDFATVAGAGLFPGLGSGQSGPNEGADEGGVITNVVDPYAGFLNTPDGFDFSLLNFDNENLYPGGIAQVTFSAVSSVPEPTTALLLSVGVMGLAASRRRRIHPL